MSGRREIWHGSAVALRGKGMLIIGPSGSGKSRLALDLIALGGALVSDDAVELCPRGNAILMRAPGPISGMIEARGVGLLGCPVAGETPLAVVVDLSRVEPDRLPPEREISVLGLQIPLLWTPEGGHAASALQLLLTHGRRA